MVWLGSTTQLSKKYTTGTPSETRYCARFPKVSDELLDTVHVPVKPVSHPFSSTAGGAGGGPGGIPAGPRGHPDCAAAKASTSCLVIRPPAPVPLTWVRSRLRSRAILRTSGESGPAGSLPAGSAGSAGIGRGSGRERGEISGGAGS